MTTPLDRDLAERLERLAAAVPVRAGQLDPVHATAVRARQQVRMRWLTPLVALVLVGLGAGIVGIGPLNILNGPIETTTRLGDFVLTFHSAKARYASGEPIELSASLTYEGPSQVVRITHAHGTPFGFGLREPVNGITLSPGWRMSCEITDLVKGLPLVHDFRKSGGDTSDTPGFERFMQDPTLHLTAGTWHAYAVAQFGTGECGGSVELRADLTIEVFDRPTPTAPPTFPVPETAAIHIVNLDPSTVEVEFRNRSVAWLSCGESVVLSSVQLESSAPWHFIFRDERGSTVGAATLDWHLPAGILICDGAVLSGPWPMSYGPAASCDVHAEPLPSPSQPPDVSQSFTETDGDFELVLTSDKRVYRPDEPIRIEARLTYHGSQSSMVIGHDMGSPISFGIAEKVFGLIQVGGLSLLTCEPTTLVRDEPLIEPFRKSGGVLDGQPHDEEMVMAWMRDPVLRLPVGTWHVTASAGSPCMGMGASFSVGGQLTIVVADDPHATSGPPIAF